MNTYLSLKPFFVLFVIAGSFTYFAVHAKTLFNLMMAVQKKEPQNRSANLLARTQAVFMDVFLQRKVREKKVAGTAHSLIFWGFIIITIGTVEMMMKPQKIKLW